MVYSYQQFGKTALPALTETSQSLKQRDSSLTLGKTIVEAHGISTEGKQVVVVHNFVPGQDSNGVPISLIPSPLADAYLQFLCVPAVGKNEIALTPPLQPGVFEYFKNIGFIDELSGAIEVPLNIVDGKLGYPYSDVLSCAVKSGLKLNGRVVTTLFSDSGIREQINSLKGSPVQLSHARETSNKSAFREASNKYGWNMPPGFCLYDEISINNAINTLKDYSCTWMKLNCGSGGDMVYRIPGPLTEEKILKGIKAIRQSVEDSFKVADFKEADLDSYWDLDSLLPTQGTITIEANIEGVTGSNVVVIKSDGSFEVKGYFSQRITDKRNFEGLMEYEGSIPFTPNQEQKMAIDYEVSKVVKYCVEELNLYGIVGLDYILSNNNGFTEVSFIELNGRPPISSTAKIIADKALAKSWINLNIWTSEEINTLDDLRKALTIDGTSLLDAPLSEGKVVLQAMRAIYNYNEMGEKNLIYPSHGAKILICGDTNTACDRVLELLKRSGITFSSNQ